MFRKILSAGIAAAALGWGAAAAHATDLSLAHGFPANSAIDEAYKELAEIYKAETGNQVQLYTMSLLDLRQTSQGITDGSADVGAIMLPYHPAEYSESLLIGDLSTLLNVGDPVASIGAAFAGAQMEYIMFNCDECRDQYRRLNQVFLGSGTGSQFGMLCSRPIRSTDDLKGKKIKATSPNFQRWVEHYGAVAVNIPGNEMFQGLSQNIIDCTINAPAELTNFSLFEVVKSVITDIPGGTYGGTALSMMNRDVWNEMTPDERTAFLKASAHAGARLTTEFAKRSIADLQKVRDMGNEVTEASPEFAAATREFLTNDILTLVDAYSTTYGLQNVQAKVDQFTPLLEKWKTLTNRLEPTDTEGLAKLYWDELLSKVDVNTYEVK